MYARPFYTVVSFVLFLIGLTYPVNPTQDDITRYTRWVRLLFDILPMDSICVKTLHELLPANTSIKTRAMFVDLVFTLHERILETSLNRAETLFLFDQLRASECGKDPSKLEQKESGCVRKQRTSANACHIFFHKDSFAKNTFIIDKTLIVPSKKDIEHDTLVNQNAFCSCVFSAKWFLLHMIASQFPQNVTPKMSQMYTEWLQLFGDVLACFACRMNFRNNMQAIGFDASHDTQSRYAFEMLIYRLHSAVNDMLGQPNIGFHDMKLLYNKLYTDVQNNHFVTIAITPKDSTIRFFDLI